MNADLSTVLFPVEKKPIFLDTQLKQLNLFSPGTQKKRYNKIPRFQAILDVETNYVFSVVTEDYRLVLNKEALDLGRDCFKTVFSEATAKGIEVFNIIMPKTRSFCHVDFKHSKRGIEPWAGDTWAPFLRITNSYNRTKPLGFDVGFCRSICTNGVIFGEKSIRFRYVHTRGAVLRTAEFKTTFGELKSYEANFIEKLNNLKRYYIPKEQMFPLTLSVFNILGNQQDLQKPKRRAQLLELSAHVDSLTDKYFTEIGPNGYAALNVLTDFASRPLSYISPETMVHRLQKRTGQWVDEFLKTIQDVNFDFDTYLGPYAEFAQVLNANR